MMPGHVELQGLCSVKYLNRQSTKKRLSVWLDKIFFTELFYSLKKDQEVQPTGLNVNVREPATNQKEIKKMKTNRLTLTFVSLMAVFAILITACTPAAVPTPEQVVVEKTVEVVVSPTPEPEGPVTITFWHAYNADVEAKFLDETLIPEFEAAHPNIKVESVLVPYDQFRRKLLISLSGGTAPDLARWDIIWVPYLSLVARILSCSNKALIKKRPWNS